MKLYWKAIISIAILILLIGTLFYLSGFRFTGVEAAKAHFDMLDLNSSECHNG